MSNTQPSTPVSREALIRALIAKRVLLANDWRDPLDMRYARAELVADAIRAHDLTEVQTGLRHDGRGTTFSRAFELVYGERLTLRKERA